ncbi:MAG TPA: AAA family ATPase, partial [Myxococcota bacterium]|nr:AAA family ATPase [Myxococcota bacterium]
MSGQIITCYSYKGGVGRTMAMANMAVLMALRGRRVLCVDWDLEAPGLHLYFKGEKARVGPGSTGLLDLVEALALDSGASWEAHVRPVKLAAPGKLDLLCAGVEDKDYVPRLQKLNWEQLYTENGIGEAIERLRREWTERYDVVLVDSRTGISDIGGICTIQIPDILVMF